MIIIRPAVIYANLSHNEKGRPIFLLLPTFGHEPTMPVSFSPACRFPQRGPTGCYSLCDKYTGHFCFLPFLVKGTWRARTTATAASDGYYRGSCISGVYTHIGTLPSLARKSTSNHQKVERPSGSMSQKAQRCNFPPFAQLRRSSNSLSASFRFILPLTSARSPCLALQVPVFFFFFSLFLLSFFHLYFLIHKFQRPSQALAQTSS